MFQFFRICVTALIASFFMLSGIVFTDAFVNNDEFIFTVMTIMMGFFFLIIGLAGIVVYQNLKILYQSVSKKKEEFLGRLSAPRLLFLLGIMAIAITIFVSSICFRLLERMKYAPLLFGKNIHRMIP